MMSSETGEQRPIRLQHTGPRTQEPENLPCPRCDSTNTKFCYYNNYNLSQPRHFCKSCRRYWTRGGTLRNVPVGGATRKASTKRSRSFSTTMTTTTTVAASETFSSSSLTQDIIFPNSVSVVPVTKPEVSSGISLFGHADLNRAPPLTGPLTSLLNTQTTEVVLPYCGYGLGIGSGYRTTGFSLGMLDWPMETVVKVNDGGNGVGDDGSTAASSGTVPGAASGCNTWHIGGAGGGLLADGDSFIWPNIAISLQGKDSSNN